MKKRQNDKISNFSYYICTTEIVGYKEKINVSTLDTLNTWYIKNTYFRNEILDFLAKTKWNHADKMVVKSCYFHFIA